jgi:hypothetical protein
VAELGVNYSYAPVPTIREFARSNAEIRGLMGPFGSGKSSGCVIEILRRAIAQPPGADGVRRTRWACVRNSYPQLRDTTIKTLHQWLQPGVLGEWKANDHTLHLKFNDVQAEIMFRALDRPDQVGNLLSLELTGAWINEAREIDWSIVQALYGRCGRFPRQQDGGALWSGLIMDTNPPSDDSWWFRLFEIDKPANAALFRQPSGSSPQAENLPNLKPGYYDGLKSVNSVDWCRVHVDGQYGYVQDGKPCYPEYSDDIHCTDKAEYITGATVYRGWDFGLTPACVLSHLTASGRWIVFDELVADNVGIERFSERVLQRMAERYPNAKCEDVGDPAGEQRSQTDEKTCYQILQAKGILISAGQQDLAMRLESVKRPLHTLADGKPTFALHPRCETLRRGFMGRYRYARMQTSQERYTDAPEKNAYSHPHDALQYVATRLFGQGLRTYQSTEPPRRERYGRRQGMDSWLTA